MSSDTPDFINREVRQESVGALYLRHRLQGPRQPYSDSLTSLKCEGLIWLAQLLLMGERTEVIPWAVAFLSLSLS